MSGSDKLVRCIKELKSFKSSKTKAKKEAEAKLIIGKKVLSNKKVKGKLTRVQIRSLVSYERLREHRPLLKTFRIGQKLPEVCRQANKVNDEYDELEGRATEFENEFTQDRVRVLNLEYEFLDISYMADNIKTKRRPMQNVKKQRQNVKK